MAKKSSLPKEFEEHETSFMERSSGNTTSSRALLNRLYLASKYGDVDSLKNIVESDPHILCVPLGTYTDTPIHVAILRGHLKFVETLLEVYPPLIAVKDADGYTPLHLAAANGHHDIVNRLLVHGYPDDCFKRDQEERLPIHLAVMRGHNQVLEEFLNHHHVDHAPVKADHCTQLLCQTVDQGDNFLHLSLKHGNLDALKMLVTYCRRNGQEDMLKSEDKDGNTLIHLAVLHKQTETIKYLIGPLVLGEGAVSMLNGERETPLDMLMQECGLRDSKFIEMMEMLTEKPPALIDEDRPRRYRSGTFTRKWFVVVMAISVLLCFTAGLISSHIRQPVTVPT